MADQRRVVTRSMTVNVTSPQGVRFIHIFRGTELDVEQSVHAAHLRDIRYEREGRQCKLTVSIDKLRLHSVPLQESPA